MSKLQLHKTQSEQDFQEFMDFQNEIYSIVRNDPDRNSRDRSSFINPLENYQEGCYLVKKDSKTIARFTLYINPELSYNKQKTITFGSFECVHNHEIAKGVIDLIVEQSKELGFEYLLGPMEGSTWNNYRFSDHNKAPNFFMEPYHHDYYSAFFIENGFDKIAGFNSNLDTKPAVRHEDIVKAEEHFRSLGVHFRYFDKSKALEELTRIANFSNKAFQNNFLFTPIAEADFANKYMKYLDYFDTDLIIIGERENKDIVALSFSIPDHNKSNGNSMIIKSLARLPDMDLKGIGAFLIHKTYEKALEKGFENVIHAMMIKENSSVDISERFHGKDYKSYSLFGKHL